MDEDLKPRYSTKRLRQEIERARNNDAQTISALEAKLAEAERRKQELEREITGLRNSYFEERKARIAIEATPPAPKVTERKFSLGDRVTKTKGSRWTGKVVGFYSTNLTPIGYAVESDTETGSVQIYPEAALTAAQESGE